MGVTAQALHGAKVCLLPRPENNYQPLALHRRSLWAVSGIILTAKIAALGLILIVPSTAELSTITSARILQLTNGARVGQGLAALTVNDRLAQAAADKAQDMIDNDYFAHISPAGVTPWFWMQRKNYVYTVAGENLAIDFVQAEDVVDAWLASPSHRDNILQPDYAETGIAVLTGEYQGGTSTVVVHMFGLPAGAVRPSQSSSLTARLPVTETVQTTPVVTPIPAAAPIKAPAAPTLTVLGDKETVRETVMVQVTAEPGSIIHVQINDADAAEFLIDSSGKMDQNIDLSPWADGPLRVTAWAEGVTGLSSATTAPLELTKDTVGPAVNNDNYAFIVSPVTDAPEMLLILPTGEFASLTIAEKDRVIVETSSPFPEYVVLPLTEGAIELRVFDEIGNATLAGTIDLLPAIFSERQVEVNATPERFNAVARRLILVTALIMLVLLLVAVIIKIRIQHPRMITHASLVILLAVILLFV